ncbi:MAG TPA: hypothetical protein VJL58_02220 [Pyrinomonadaceae bacterium]|nr:hypothetical protein [Pyrinomonadaceae bacterium]
MKLVRLLSPSLLVFIVGVLSPLPLYSVNPVCAARRTSYRPFFVSAFNEPYATDFHGNIANDVRHFVVQTPTNGGIVEDIPEKYKERFERWKSELLSTEFGRGQWERYANNKQFILTIAVSGKRGKGAGTDVYLWDDSHNLVGATITLGDDLDKGYPNPIYYPVMNSLSSGDTSYSISGRILAAAKMSHELGHVNQTSNANKKLLQIQDKLMPVYTSIFLKNGWDTTDEKLVELAEQMGGTPIEIWESREYWSEVNAMLFLKERISKEDFYCYVFNRIKNNLELYAKNYEKRFDSEVSDSPCWK